MEIASIKGDIVLLIYHPADSTAVVGQQFKILQLPDCDEGLVIQVISNDSLEYMGLQQEIIQNMLEQHISRIERPLNREFGMNEIKSLKIATAKIRKKILNGNWIPWDGWIPTRNVQIELISGQELLQNIIPNVVCPLCSFTAFNDLPIRFDGTKLNMVSVVTGVKGSGKSHLAKHLVLALNEWSIPTFIFDINGEYTELPNIQIIQWGQNFQADLAQVGYEILENIVKTIAPLPAASENAFDTGLRNAFQARERFCSQQHISFTIDIQNLRGYTWGQGQDYIQGAIDRRLESIESMNLFCSVNPPQGIITSIRDIFDAACNGQPVVFDMRNLSSILQHALAKFIVRALENICIEETNNNTNRYPFVFFEEAHFYISDSAILNIITRGRHIGIGSFFVTNTPEKLPDTVFRQLDNLFLLNLTHKDDIRNVSKNSFTDSETIENFATRMPENHALFIGRITDRYPLIVRIDPLPEEIPPTGQTRSTWTRFELEQPDEEQPYVEQSDVELDIDQFDIGPPDSGEPR